jgi:hypothetical protein
MADPQRAEVRDTADRLTEDHLALVRRVEFLEHACADQLRDYRQELTSQRERLRGRLDSEREARRRDRAMGRVPPGDHPYPSHLPFDDTTEGGGTGP